MYFNLPNNHTGWNKRAGWSFLRFTARLLDRLYSIRTVLAPLLAALE